MAASNGRKPDYKRQTTKGGRSIMLLMITTGPDRLLTECGKATRKP